MHALTFIRSIDLLSIPMNDNEIIEGWRNDVIFSKADWSLTNGCVAQVNAHIYTDYIHQRSVSRVYGFRHGNSIFFFRHDFSDR